ncbi:unnamed protein product, partial [Nesidiocoris tenuis]
MSGEKRKNIAEPTSSPSYNADTTVDPFLVLKSSFYVAKYLDIFYIPVTQRILISVQISRIMINIM